MIMKIGDTIIKNEKLTANMSIMDMIMTIKLNFIIGQEKEHNDSGLRM